MRQSYQEQYKDNIFRALLYTVSQTFCTELSQKFLNQLTGAIPLISNKPALLK